MKGMLNIQGAFLKEKYRGCGIFQELLEFVINSIAGEGQLLLGVDFESFNPEGRNFWLKYFQPYIYGMTRRIDERIMKIYE